MKNKNIKIFIAGHNGMVGRSIVKFFKKKNFGQLILASRKELNLENSRKVNNFIKKKKPYLIINCAGRVGGILANSSYPTQFLNENISIQSNLINSAFKNNIDHFFNLGSSCIYPRNSKQPIKEKYLLSDSLEKTNEAYALAKIVGLKLCYYYNLQYNKNYLTLMPCNLYGSNDNFDLKDSHFIPALIKKIINNKKGKKEPVEIWGTGRPLREVMHVDDLASAIYFVIISKLNNNKKLNKILENTSLINIGSGKEYSIKQVAKMICKLTNNKNGLIFNKQYPDGTMRKILDNNFMRRLGWKPKIGLNQGLSKTLKWYKKNYHK